MKPKRKYLTENKHFFTFQELTKFKIDLDFVISPVKEWLKWMQNPVLRKENLNI